MYEVDVQADFRHSGARLSDSGQVAEVPQSPFPPRSRFGIVPYAVWHGHDAVVAAYLHVLGANVDGQAAVSLLCPSDAPCMSTCSSSGQGACTALLST